MTVLQNISNALLTQCLVYLIRYDSVLHVQFYIYIGPPVIEPGITTTFSVNKSDSVTFSCYAEASPSINNVTWKKEVDGVMTIIESVQMSFVFTISSVDVKDTGRYTCNVTNVLGSTIRIFRLNVAEGKNKLELQYYERKRVKTVMVKNSYNVKKTNNCI